MITIHADFNAMTENHTICLTTLGSQADIQKYGFQLGDRVKLSDGELEVEAVVAEDSYYGWVGIPEWETRVDIEFETPVDVNRA